MMRKSRRTDCRPPSPCNSFVIDSGRAIECHNCRYNLAGLPAKGICPECGASYDKDVARRLGIRLWTGFGSVGYCRVVLLAYMMPLAAIVMTMALSYCAMWGGNGLLVGLRAGVRDIATPWRVAVAFVVDGPSGTVSTSIWGDIICACLGWGLCATVFYWIGRRTWPLWIHWILVIMLVFELPRHLGE